MTNQGNSLQCLFSNKTEAVSEIPPNKLYSALHLLSAIIFDCHNYGWDFYVLYTALDNYHNGIKMWFA